MGDSPDPGSEVWVVRRGGLGLVAGLLFLAGPALLLSGCGSGDRVDVVRAVEHYERAAQASLWPGFRPRDVPLAIYADGFTYLARHPSPPEGFFFFRGRDDIRAMRGRHPALRANTSVELAGIVTATAVVDSLDPPSSRRLAALLVHEAFHVHQDSAHPEWTANEVDLFTYPIRDADLLRRRRLETEALRRALTASDSLKRLCWTAELLRIRRNRFARLPGEAAAYERGAELREGLAQYVESAAATELGLGAAMRGLPREGYPPEAVRSRAYDVGEGLAHLLDDVRPGWKELLEEAGRGEGRTLDGLLADAETLAATPAAQLRRCGITPDESRRARAVAREDLRRLAEEDASLLREFETRPGWRVTVEAAEAAPLFPAAFDPLNVRVLGDISGLERGAVGGDAGGVGAAVLHTRWLQLSNGSGELEVLDRRALTEAAGEHPLFQGVRRLTVTGIGEEPVAETRGDTLSVEAPGFTARFAGASLERTSDRSWRISLGGG